jgi:hypothetical protein
MEGFDPPEQGARSFGLSHVGEPLNCTMRSEAIRSGLLGLHRHVQDLLQRQRRDTGAAQKRA